MPRLVPVQVPLDRGRERGEDPVGADPLDQSCGLQRDEEVLLELLRGEAATQGPSAALARYEAYRRSLRDELGSDPGPALQALHRRLLQGAAPVVRHGVPYEPNPLLGRDGDIAAVANLLRTSRVTSIVGVARRVPELSWPMMMCWSVRGW